MSRGMTRRRFLKTAGAAGIGAAALTPLLQAVSREVALAQTGGTLGYGMGAPLDPPAVPLTSTRGAGRRPARLVGQGRRVPPRIGNILDGVAGRLGLHVQSTGRRQVPRRHAA